MAELDESDYTVKRYALDGEDATEMARLHLRNQFFEETMGGLFPERTDLANIRHILDIGCGSAGWVLAVARTYPHINVVGIDISEAKISYARTEAARQGLKNAEFIRMDALQTLNFPDRHFDLVNLCLAVRYIPRDRWTFLLQECYRITQPGGILRLLEIDRLGLTNSSTFETCHLFWSRMMHTKGYGFSSDGHTLGITPMLGKLLHDAAYKQIRLKSYALDLSYGSVFQKQYHFIVELRFKLMLTQYMEQGLTTPEEFNSIYNDLIHEMADEMFCGLAYPLIIWCER